MSKNQPRKLSMKNKSNSLKFIAKKKHIFKSFQYGQENKIKKNQVNKLIFDNKEINNDLDNKENINIINTSREGNIIQDFSLDYSKNNNNNEYSIKEYEKIDNLDYYKKKKDRKILSKKFLYNNNNKNLILKTINSIGNKFTNELKRKINKIENINSTFNRRLTQKNNDCNITTDKRPLTQRESNNNIIKNYNSNINRINNNNTLNLKNNYFLPKNNCGKKTLILDLDETLIHSSYKSFNIDNEFTINICTKKKSDNNVKQQYIIYVIKRPYVELFLSVVCEIFEVVIFTASVPIYANLILNEIDVEKKIKHRLFRDHCIKIDKDKYIKNLYCLGRDLKNVIIIDNNPLSYTLNIENGLPISTWETNQNDNELIKLIPILQYLSLKNISDVRPIIKKIVNNNSINYDEVNKIMNKINNIRKEKEKNSNDNINKKINKEINENIDGKTITIKSKIFKKLEYKDNDIYYYNNSISSNQNILKNIFVNRENQRFIKNLRNINKKNNRGKSEDHKLKKKFFFQDSEERTISSINKIKNLNLSEKYLITKNKKSKNNIISDIIKKNKGNKTFIEKKKRKELNIPIPTNYLQIFPKNYNNSITRNKLFSKNPCRININKNNSYKLFKNFSDFNHSINNNSTKSNKYNILHSIKYPPTLKNVFYHKIFQNNRYNKNEIISLNDSKYSSDSSKKNNKAILTTKNSQKKLLFNFKRNIINFKDNKTKNYSFESYLNKKYNMTLLRNNLNKYLTKFIINNQKNNKEKNINNDNETMRENNSFKVNRSNYNIFYINKPFKNGKTDNSIMKHSFSFLNKNKNIKDYMSIINK